MEMRKFFYLILFVDLTASFDIISSFTDFERASRANIKGRLSENKSFGEHVDLSLCLRFQSFFKQKTTIGILQICFKLYF